ncbi:hypothetical protein SAMN05660686_05011, partial [Thalassobaculum litoreum DSM 18839]
ERLPTGFELIDLSCYDRHHLRIARSTLDQFLRKLDFLDIGELRTQTRLSGKLLVDL